MKAYIHIGTHKTGTTALQKFFILNKKNLLERGYCYPQKARQQNKENKPIVSHHYLAAYLGFKGSKKILENTNFELTRQEWKHFIFSETKRQNCSSIILSSELFSRPKSIDAIQNLKAIFSGIETKIICYLRRQDHYLVSMYNQSTKSANNFTKNITEFIENIEIDYYTLLTNYATVFGKENIIVKQYDYSLFKDNSIFSDICSAVGIDKIDSWEQPKKENSNISLNQDIIDLITLIKKNYPKEKAIEIIKHVKELDYKGVVPPKSILSTEQRKQILNKYRDSNKKIAKEFLNKSYLFDETDLSQNSEQDEYQELSANHLLPIIVELLEKIND